MCLSWFSLSLLVSLFNLLDLVKLSKYHMSILSMYITLGVLHHITLSEQRDEANLEGDIWIGPISSESHVVIFGQEQSLVNYMLSYWD